MTNENNNSMKKAQQNEDKESKKKIRESGRSRTKKALEIQKDHLESYILNNLQIAALKTTKFI